MGKRVRGMVGDVGGTNARFALAEVDGGTIRLEEPVTLKAADYKTGEDAVCAFLDKVDGKRPKFAVIAAAGPVKAGAVAFTNNKAWKYSEGALTKSCGFKGVRLINDFTAQALAIDHLRSKDRRRIGPDRRGERDATAVILGPGTGFGAAALAADGTGRAVVTGEGGHVSFAPCDDEEIEIVRRLSAKFGRVSVERVLSGPGLLNLYQALADIAGQTAVYDKPDAVTKAGLAGEALPKAALSRFCAILGAVAGDFALAFGARRGVYVSGGIAPDVLPFLEASAFRERFEAKGRMSEFLQSIPTFVVTDPHIALRGAASDLPALEAAA
jgi:glucokinase